MHDVKINITKKKKNVVNKKVQSIGVLCKQVFSYLHTLRNLG